MSLDVFRLRSASRGRIGSTEGGILLGLLLVVPALPGCGDSGDPVPPGCRLEPRSLDFGEFVARSQPPVSQLAILGFELENLPETIAKAGNEDLVGTVQIRITSAHPTPPIVELFPGTNPNFKLGVYQTAFFQVRATIPPEVSHGLHEGVVELGESCPNLTFRVRVLGSEDPPPFRAAWPDSASGQVLESPASAATDSNGDLYVVTTADGVMKFDKTGKLLLSWTQWIDPWIGTQPTGFFSPRGIAVDGNDNVYVTDVEAESGNQRVSQFTSTGSFVKRWGHLPEGSLFTSTRHLDVAPDGNLYVVDSEENRVLRLAPSADSLGYAVIDTLGSEGGGPGQFRNPFGVAVDGVGNVYVVDRNNNRIHRFTKDGNFLLQWGRAGKSGGEFSVPTGVAVDGGGFVFVVDEGNNRIQKFDAGGTYLTSWGMSGDGPSQLDMSLDIAADASGNVFLVDSGNDRIQWFGPEP